MRFKESEYFDYILVHIIFSIITTVLLLLPVEAAIGLRLLIVVIAYNVLIPVWAIYRKQENWLKIWLFVIPISIIFIFPDWFLASVLQVLVFPNDGFPMIGEVPIYMAGLWAIPFFNILYIGSEVQNRYSTRHAYLMVAIVSLLIFILSEETLWMLPSWSAQNVVMIGHVAAYIIIPELILGLSLFFAYNDVRMTSIWQKLVAAFVIMVFYIGNAAFFYFVIERLILAG